MAEGKDRRQRQKAKAEVQGRRRRRRQKDKANLAKAEYKCSTREKGTFLTGRGGKVQGMGANSRAGWAIPPQL